MDTVAKRCPLSSALTASQSTALSTAAGKIPAKAFAADGFSKLLKTFENFHNLMRNTEWQLLRLTTNHCQTIQALLNTRLCVELPAWCGMRRWGCAKLFPRSPWTLFCVESLWILLIHAAVHSAFAHGHGLLTWKTLASSVKQECHSLPLLWLYYDSNCSSPGRESNQCCHGCRGVHHAWLRRRLWANYWWTRSCKLEPQSLSIHISHVMVQIVLICAKRLLVTRTKGGNLASWSNIGCSFFDSWHVAKIDNPWA